MTMYCSSIGVEVEHVKYHNISNRQYSCFVKIMTCSHKVKDANVIPTEVHNCIMDHALGELK